MILSRLQKLRMLKYYSIGVRLKWNKKIKLCCFRLSYSANCFFFCYQSFNTIEMDKKQQKCKNNPNIFCFICGKYTLPKQCANITEFVKKA